MPTLQWLGKDKVITHHLAVPFCFLEKQYTYQDGAMAEGESENKIIQGDNLLALKSLLPEYAGKVKCIYIDPPYNTGNEGWVYNDNVNDPKIKKWLGQVVGKEGEDLSRHDKWLCMMYPRLVLLQRLLAEDGAIFISIDDNEQANLRLICDEIFGEGNFAAQVIWQKVYSPRMDAVGFSNSHDYILCYTKRGKLSIKKEEFEQNVVQFNFVDGKTGLHYRRRSVRKEGSHSTRIERPNLYYPLIDPDGGMLYPIKPDGTEGCWRWSKNTYNENVELNLVEWVKTISGWQVYAKQYLSGEASRPPVTLWTCDVAGHNHGAIEDLKAILGGRVFDSPKPKELIMKALLLCTDKDSIILDSFAGSGTTAHAVLNLNKQDGGNRKFILVEMEDYAESITAERVRRVMGGYGTTPGTGGGFSYYTLGEPLFDQEANVSGKVTEDKLRAYVYFMEARQRLPKRDRQNPYLLGEHAGTAYYFYYKAGVSTTLNAAFLAGLPISADRCVIYASRCTVGQAELARRNIVFKKIPRDISRL